MAKNMSGQLSLFSLIPSAADTHAEEEIEEKKTAPKKKKKSPKADTGVCAVKKFMEKYNGFTIEDLGVVTGDDFSTWCRALKSALKKDATAMGYEEVTLNKGHYFISGFLKKDGQYVYYSFSVERGEPTFLDRKDVMHQFLYRTARHDKDFSGGRNNFTTLPNLLESASALMELERNRKQEAATKAA